MTTWYDQVKAGKFPTCPEVCESCMQGIHVFHIQDELSDLYGTWYVKEVAGGGTRRIIRISGYAEDELWLTQLFEMISLLYKKE